MLRAATRVTAAPATVTVGAAVRLAPTSGGALAHTGSNDCGIASRTTYAAVGALLLPRRRGRRHTG